MSELFDYPKPTAAELARYTTRPTLRLTRYDRAIAQSVWKLLKQSNGLTVEDIRGRVGISNTARARAFLSHLEVEGKTRHRNGLWIAQESHK